MNRRSGFPLSALLLIALATVPPAGGAAATQSEPTPVERIRKDAAALEPLVSSDPGRRFLRATADLPSVTPRVAFREPASGRYLDEAAAARLPEPERAALKRLELDEGFYYNTRYGSPLAYVRPIEILAGAGLSDFKGKRLLDFGYGTVGHLRLMALLGADAVGVDVDGLLPLLYARPGDQGPVTGPSGAGGRITLLHGQYPADAATRAAAGNGYDLFLSKNTLKNGYIHPERPVDPKRLVHLGVDDAAFLAAVHDALKPGGLFLIYNLSPAPAPPDKDYIPWSDGRSPFSESQWAAAGFELLAYNRVDDTEARRMARALGWDQGSSPMDLEKNLFALYTLARRRAP